MIGCAAIFKKAFVALFASPRLIFCRRVATWMESVRARKRRRLLARCGRWHVLAVEKVESIGEDGTVAVRRCEECGAHLGNLGHQAGLKCPFSHHHRVGVALQRRTDAECGEIAWVLQQCIGLRALVLLVMEFDHGGSREHRRAIGREAALKCLCTIMEAGLARKVAACVKG